MRMEKLLTATILLLAVFNADAATLTVSKAFSDFMYQHDEVRFEATGVDKPAGQGRLTDNVAGFAGFDESLYGDLVQVDASFQYLIDTRYFARIDDGFGTLSADISISERIFIRRATPPFPAILINDVVNTETFSPSCTADTGSGCLDFIEDTVGMATPYEFTFTGTDAKFFLETVFLGVLFDLSLDNVSSTATEDWRVAGGTKPESNPNALFQANVSLTYTYQDVAAVPVPAAVWLFATALIGLAGLGRRATAA